MGTESITKISSETGITVRNGIAISCICGRCAEIIVRIIVRKAIIVRIIVRTFLVWLAVWFVVEVCVEHYWPTSSVVVLAVCTYPVSLKERCGFSYLFPESAASLRPGLIVI